MLVAGRKLLRVPQALQRVPVGRSKFYELLNAGRIKSLKLDGCRMIEEAEIDRFIGSLSGGEIEAGDGL